MRTSTPITLAALAAVGVATVACGGDGAFELRFTVTPFVGEGVACDVVVLDDGTVVVAANFEAGPADLGGGELPSVEPRTILAAYAPDGAHRWSVATGPPCRALAVGAGGQLFLLGQEAQMASVTSFLPDGTEQWRQVFVQPVGAVEARDLVAKPDGDMVMVGAVRGEWELGEVDFVTTDLGWDGFVMLVGPFADELAGTLYHGDDDDEIDGVAAGPDGAVFVTGVRGGETYAAKVALEGTAIRTTPLEAGTVRGVAALDGGVLLALDGDVLARFDGDGARAWGSSRTASPSRSPRRRTGRSRSSRRCRMDGPG